MGMRFTSSRPGKLSNFKAVWEIPELDEQTSQNQELMCYMGTHVAGFVKTLRPKRYPKT